MKRNKKNLSKREVKFT